MLENKHINFNQLYYFHVIAQHGSLQEAAKCLHVSVSTLSEHLRGLEGRLDVQLFDREGRKLVLNETGRHVLEHTTMMFNISTKLLSDLDGVAHDTTTYLDIGITPSVSKLHTVQFLEPLFTHPDFKVRIRESQFNDLLKDLSSMAISLIISNEPLPEKAGGSLMAHCVEKVRYVFVGGPRFAQVTGDFPYNLKGLPLFNYTLDSHVRWQIDGFLKDHGVVMRRFGEADDVSLQRAAARSNMCIALMPVDLVRDHVRDGKLFILGQCDEITTNLNAIYHDLFSDRLVKLALDSLINRPHRQQISLT